MRADSVLGRLVRALGRRTPAFRAAPGDRRFAQELVTALARSGPAFRPDGEPDASRQRAEAGPAPGAQSASASSPPAGGDPVAGRGQVLVVEDDPATRSRIAAALQDAGYLVQPVRTALDALRALADDPVDLVVLDLGLRDLDGLSALRMLRGVSDVPVVVTSARTDEPTILRLLNAGADDYLTKPYSSEHLTARLAAVTRRGRPPAGPIVVGELVVDPGRREARLGGTPLELTPREFDLLAHLAARRGQVVSTAELAREVWRQPAVRLDQTINVHLGWLRRKLGETAAAPRYLRPVPGVGVRLVDPSDTDPTSG
jgi:DNA-binding response OmpR family regulator